ncbi:SDR family NAD(P)-dependent oxidoreductase [Nocardioides ochotonae]|uniref:SDR family NAD(P)-dependent oxidoreductase n=1 Tax=Nocardioides ochotonae TaxID=2685869 RepID=UPI00140D378F|nr:SDR family NAD(P)-dependent oxidoreductase [Nocardioides ochotonae]
MDSHTDAPLAPLALVTGASTGIGLALARQFADHGFDLVVVAEEDRIHDVARELASSGRRRVVPVQADLRTAAGVDSTWATVDATGARLEAVALNAGVGVSGRFDQIPLQDDLSVVDLNVRSTVHLAKLATRVMVSAGRGRVLITSSIAAVAPGPFQATYAASKAFVHSFAEGLRQDLRDTGVTVTSMMPGPTATEFFARADMEDTPLGRMKGKDDPETVAKEGFEAMMAGRSSVVPGSFKNRLQAEIGTHLPDALATPLLARLTKPRD